MKWDEIEKVDFKPWENYTNLNAVISAANTQTGISPNFTKIKNSVKILENNSNKPFSLNLKQYEDEKKQLKAVYKQLEEAYKLAKAMDVKNIVADTVEINKTKEKIDRNKQFVKRVGEDIYIDESVKILNKMIVNDKMAKRN